VSYAEHRTGIGGDEPWFSVDGDGVVLEVQVRALGLCRTITALKSLGILAAAAQTSSMTLAIARANGERRIWGTARFFRP
jgi:hypothetical protein